MVVVAVTVVVVVVMALVQTAEKHRGHFSHLSAVFARPFSGLVPRRVSSSESIVAKPRGNDPRAQLNNPAGIRSRARNSAANIRARPVNRAAPIDE